MANGAIVVEGVVQNVIVLDDGAEVALPEGAILVESDTAMIGDGYDGSTFCTPAAVAPTLTDAQATQIAMLYAAYRASVQAPVVYQTVAGVSQTFQADDQSQNMLLLATTGYSMAGATPSGFYWVAADNTQVPFGLDDLKGLYGVMLAQGNNAFQKLQTLKAAVRAAMTVEQVSSVTWGTVQAPIA